MIKISTPYKLITLVFASAFFFIIRQVLSNNGGSPAGKTGAPGETNCSSCHTGTAVSNSSSVLVFTNMTNGQYIPDSIYQIKIRAKKNACVRFGFSTTLLNANATPSKLGTLMLPTGATAIQLSTGTRDYITHTSSGAPAIYTDSTEWILNWKAPSSLSGDAKLYIAVCATNNNGDSLGDQTHLKDFTFPQTTNVPVATIITNVNTICQVDSIYFQGSGTNNTTSYQWIFPGGTPATSTAQNVWVKFTSGSKTCSLRVANNIMYSTYTTKTVTINANPSAGISYNSTVTLCEGDSLSLSTFNNPTLTYQWQKDGDTISGATRAQYYAKASGSYRVIVTNANGCSVITSPVTLNFNTRPFAVLTALNGTSACQGDSILLKTTSGANYSYYWFKDNILIAQSLDSTFYVYQSGDYNVKIFSNVGCNMLSNTLSIGFNNLPSGNIASQTDSICDGNTVLLNAFSLDTIVSYQWYKDNVAIGGANHQDYFADATGSYTVELITNRGCTAIFPAKQIKVNPYPPANFIDSARSGCFYLLNVRNTGNYTYQWIRDGSLFNSTDTLVTATQTGLYSLIVFNSSGCSITTNTIFLNINPPNATLTPSTNAVICSGDSVTLQVPAATGTTFSWYKNGTLLSAGTQNSLMVKDSGNYYVVVDNGKCTATSSLRNVKVIAPPIALITPLTNAVICSDSIGVTYQVPAASGTTFKWYKNGTLINGASQNSLNIVDSGNYYVTADNGSCSVTSATRNVKVNPTPVALISTNDSAFCTGDSSVLTANNVSGASYQWSKNNLPLSNTNSAAYIVKATGIYNVKVILGSCSKISNSITVTEKFLPAVPVITRNSDILTSNLASSYQWFKNGLPVSGATQQSYTVTGNGTYTVQITGSNGCKNISAGLFVIPTGLNESFLVNIVSAYPNPVQSNLFLNFADFGLHEIKVIDASGRTLLTFIETGSRITIDFRDVESGVYFVKVSSDPASQIIRVVKK